MAAPCALAAFRLAAPAAAQTCPPEPALLELVVADAGVTCLEPGDSLLVELRMSCLDQPVSGYQAFLGFDPAVLSFTAGQYALPAPFGLPLVFPISAVAGEVDLAAGINVLIGQPPTQASALLATLSFEAVGAGPAVVGFRPHNPPSRLISEDLAVIPALRSSAPLAVRGDCALLHGDVNCDGFVTLSDIAGFVLVLTDPAAYAATYPLCDPLAADVNLDGVISVGDIGPFVVLLVS